MGFLPIFLDAADLPVVVIGGAVLAEERTRFLLDAGARVTVISPAITRILAQLAAAGRIQHHARDFVTGDLQGFALGYCTIDDVGITRAAAAEARAIGIPLNVTDQPQLCTFIVPAMVKRGPLQVAVSTGGASPALASLLRHDLDAILGPEYETLVGILGAARERLFQRDNDPSKRAAISRDLVRDLRDALLRHDDGAVDGIVRRHLGVSLDHLGLEMPATPPPSSAAESI